MKKPPVTKGSNKRLMLKSNIDNIDYEEVRRDILTAYPTTPKLPQALREVTRLLGHQCEGVARLQHLFSRITDALPGGHPGRRYGPGQDPATAHPHRMGV